MIIALLLKPLWVFIKFLIGLEFDFMATIPNWYNSFYSLIRIGLAVFPIDVWMIVIGNLVFWMGVHLASAVIHWIYNKIPGIN